jgi:hypothetical protein
LRSILKSKKGATLDNFYVAISFFGFAVAMLVFLLIWHNLTSSDLNAQLWDKTPEGTNAKANVQSFVDDMDLWVVMIYIFLHLGILIVAFLLRSHPIMYIVGIFLIIILILITDPLQDTWNELYADDDFSSVSSDMPITNQIMNRLTLFECIWGFLTLIVLCGLAKTEGMI